ncbi:MAG TPA: 16S rRNA (adenine(1518)-N(6)/adenine(1519)-N(6))-dimethyltransferase RsmA [Candidatus Bathyarchaeia archaeon]
MGLSETKRLLRIFRITPNKLMGQNFLVEGFLHPKLTDYAALNRNDVVLDAGAGFGFLARFLSGKCKTVVTVEKDRRIVEILREQVKGLSNVVVVEGDMLKVALPEFNKVVTIPPYYLSSHLVLWLLERNVDCAVLILQKEFVNRLVANVASEDYGWLAVIANYRLRIDVLDEVPKTMFYPQPEVNSVIVRLTPWRIAPFCVNDEAFFNRLVRWLFTDRNKKLNNALVSFLKTTRHLDKVEAKKCASKAPLGERRVRELTPRDFGDLANVFSE